MSRPGVHGAAPRRRRGGGFTLVELLVAVAILAVVSATVALVLGVGVESWRAAARLAETGHDGESVAGQVTLALRSACYPTDGELYYDYGFQHEDGGEGPEARDVVSWTKIGSALVGEDVPWAGSAHRVRLYVDDHGPDGPGLYAAAWQLVGQPEDFDAEEDPVPVLLSDMVVGLDVRMQDPEKAEQQGEPIEWTDEWTVSNRIPRRVFVTLGLQPSRKGDDPQEIVRTTDMPLAELSWAPASLPENGKSGDGGENGRTGKTAGGRGDGPAEGAEPGAAGPTLRNSRPGRSGASSSTGDSGPSGNSVRSGSPGRSGASGSSGTSAPRIESIRAR